MCNSEATTKEHVPPLSLFPEKKDTYGIDFRKNLITVPSCEIHNSKKSDDDEFLMLSLSGLIKNNPVGTFHQLTKADRALRRKNKSFIQKEVLRNYKIGRIKSPDGNYRYIAFGNPNVKRLLKCLHHIAFGLYYEEFNMRFEGKINSLLSFIEYKDENFKTLIKLVKKRFELERELNREIKGDNPEVFYYQFHNPDENGIIGLRTVFYGTAEVYFSFATSNSTIPFNFGMKFINNGFHTTIELGDEKFEFKRLK